MSGHTSIELRDVTVSVGVRRILTSVDLSIDKGSRIALIGPSGSGKTTLLRVIAGLEQNLSSGQVLLDGDVATAAHSRHGLAPHLRSVGMVFQDLALWPHMDVRAHLTFARVGASDDVVQASIDAVGLTGREGSRPATLSGGERQRLALARALVSKPARLLLDEPFSSLDLSLRRKMIELVLKLHESHRFSLVHVTHDPREAEIVAERIVLLDQGTIVWDGSASALDEALSGQAGELARAHSWWRGR